jgi:hypothetical protein
VKEQGKQPVYGVPFVAYSEHACDQHHGCTPKKKELKKGNP